MSKDDSQNKKDYEASGLEAPNISGQMDIFDALEGRDETPEDKAGVPPRKPRRRLTVKEIVERQLNRKEP
jgi:hypothetical protein